MPSGDDQRQDSSSTFGSQDADASESHSVPILDSRDILGSGREVWIRHRGEMYRLRLTASGKLYLSK
ncbi:hemin uptake protein HemP [Roseiconus nitratireducens]|uniref:Hemin uptake protein HemP n=1 Tax=Roseiconus nitratireducens TaxID=2605748 RepID=A0A5M6CZG8_9BACT|nr:hemin uptake protein HemP [Roseiconus nitratireducens]KAA5539422.1 hemin uptake protein HemP [Roseiconus nitratireducens]